MDLASVISNCGYIVAIYYLIYILKFNKKIDCQAMRNRLRNNYQNLSAGRVVPRTTNLVSGDGQKSLNTATFF